MDCLSKPLSKTVTTTHCFRLVEPVLFVTEKVFWIDEGQTCERQVCWRQRAVKTFSTDIDGKWLSRWPCSGRWNEFVSSWQGSSQHIKTQSQTTHGRAQTKHVRRVALFSRRLASTQRCGKMLSFPSCSMSPRVDCCVVLSDPHRHDCRLSPGVIRFWPRALLWFLRHRIEPFPYGFIISKHTIQHSCVLVGRIVWYEKPYRRGVLFLSAQKNKKRGSFGNFCIVLGHFCEFIKSSGAFLIIIL